jgi:hypothetical protein
VHPVFNLHNKRWPIRGASVRNSVLSSNVVVAVGKGVWI